MSIRQQIPTAILAVLTFLVLPASADSKENVHTLAKEKYQLTRQIGKLFREKKLSDNPEYEAVQKKSFDASRAYVKAQKSHPALKELYKKSDAAQKKWINARIAKDKKAEKAARAEFTQARMDIEAAAQKVPELVEVQKKAIAANDEVKAKQKELLATTSEGKELIKKIDDLDARIAELRKKALEK